MHQLLIVSASQSKSTIVSLLLQSLDVEIICADTHTCVLEVCRNRLIELVIFLDVAPYFTSMNIVEHIRQQAAVVPAIYVIACDHSERCVLSLLECGVNQYMTFPINPHRLCGKVLCELQRGGV